MNKTTQLLKFGKLVLSMIISVLFILLSKIVKKKSNLLVIIGKKYGFTDNTKYFFLYVAEHYPRFEIVFLTDDKQLIRELSEKNYAAERLFSINGLKYLLRAKWIIVDESGWPTHHLGVIRGASFYSKKIQLWHGITIKKIELDNKYNLLVGLYSRNKILKKILTPLVRFRYVIYDMLLVPSKAQERIFMSAFGLDKKRIVYANYPRTDFLIRPNKYKNWDIRINKKLIKKIEKEKKKKTVITYLPTFRDSQENFVDNTFLNKFYNLAKENKVLFLIKPHPLDKISETLVKKFIKQKNAQQYIVLIPKNEDIYPYLLHTNILITDISSVLFDFIILKKPFILFFEDLERYLEKDREVYTKYFKEIVLRNRVCTSVDELIERIREILQGDFSEYEKKCEKIINTLKISFESGSEKILSKISEIS